MFPQWLPDKATSDAAEAETKRFLETELPRRLEHAEQVREAREARRATGDKVRWRVAWGQVAVIAAVIVAGLVLLLVLR